MLKRKWLYRLGIPAVLSGLVFIGLIALLRPSPMVRTEIYKGVYLTVEDYPSGGPVKGRVMIAEIHWDTPGVKIGHRNFNRLSRVSPTAYQFRTIPADIALWKDKAELIINTCIFLPNSLGSFIPGCKVRSVDTLVVDGKVSHVHQHSYLLYWDKDGDAFMVDRKPTPQEHLEKAVLGIGLQGIQVNMGRPGYEALDSLNSLERRAFVGIDPDRKILWLIAMEKATGRFMIDRAIEEGVLFGGQLDTGKTTHLLVGNGAKGLLPHTGIRNIRPLGPYLTIQAEKL